MAIFIREFRIGNLIQTDECGISKIYHIYEDSVMLEADKDIWKIEGIKPIPLTEEWLLKLGFIKKEMYSWSGNGADYQPDNNKTEITDYVFNHFVVRYENWGYIPKGEKEFKMELTINYYIQDWYEKNNDGYIPASSEYIHQLQNLYFALTNTELQIK